MRSCANIKVPTAPNKRPKAACKLVQTTCGTHALGNKKLTGMFQEGSISDKLFQFGST